MFEAAVAAAVVRILFQYFLEKLVEVLVVNTCFLGTNLESNDVGTDQKFTLLCRSCFLCSEIDHHRSILLRMCLRSHGNGIVSRSLIVAPAHNSRGLPASIIIFPRTNKRRFSTCFIL